MRNRAFLMVAGAVTLVAVIVVSMLLVHPDAWTAARYGSMGLLAITASLVFLMPVIIGSRAGDSGRLARLGATFVFQGVIAIWALIVLLCGINFLSDNWTWAGNVLTVVACIFSFMSVKSVTDHADRLERSNRDNRVEWVSMCMLLNNRAKEPSMKSTFQKLAESIRHSASSMDNVAKSEETEIETIIYSTITEKLDAGSAEEGITPLIDRVKELLLIRDQKLKLARSKF